MSHEWKQPLSVVRGDRAPGDRWLHSDLVLQAAFLAHRNTIDSCGHPLDESTDSANSGGPYATHKYVLDRIVRCHACAARDRELAKLPEKDRHDSSYRVAVKLVPRSAPDD